MTYLKCTLLLFILSLFFPIANLISEGAPLLNPYQKTRPQVSEANREAFLENPETIEKMKLEIESHFRDIRNGTLFLLLGSFLLIILFLNRHSIKTLLTSLKKTIFKPKDPKIIAKKALQILQSEKWGEMSIQSKGDMLTFVLKKYIEAKYGMHVHQMTREEFISFLNTLKIDSESQSILDEIFKKMDLVKFAKNEMSLEEFKIAIKQSETFVEKT